MFKVGELQRSQDTTRSSHFLGEVYKDHTWSNYQIYSKAFRTPDISTDQTKNWQLEP